MHLQYKLYITNQHTFNKLITHVVLVWLLQQHQTLLPILLLFKPKHPNNKNNNYNNMQYLFQ